jgi:hypothetical protein
MRCLSRSRFRSPELSKILCESRNLDNFGRAWHAAPMHRKWLRFASCRLMNQEGFLSVSAGLSPEAQDDLVRRLG